MSEFLDSYGSPEPDFTPIEMRHLRAIELFGQDRIVAVEGHEATPESTEALVKVVRTICLDVIPPEGYGGIRGNRAEYGFVDRALTRDDGGVIQVRTNPNGIIGFGDGVVEGGIASVVNLSDGPLWRPRGGRPFVHYRFSESLFVDPHSRQARIHRRVTGFRDMNVGTADKLATEEEVVSTIDMLARALTRDDQLRGKS